MFADISIKSMFRQVLKVSRRLFIYILGKMHFFSYERQFFSLKNCTLFFDGWIKIAKFEKFIKPEDIVLEYKCGQGYLLSNVFCKKKIGVERDKLNRSIASILGINTVEAISEVCDNSLDVIISNSFTEFDLSENNIIKSFFKKLNPNGVLILSGDVTSASLCKAMFEADCTNFYISAQCSRLPNCQFHLAKLLGRNKLILLSKLYGLLSGSPSCTFLVAGGEGSSRLRTRKNSFFAKVGRE